MKRVLLTSVGLLSILPTAAMAQESCGSSYMILPDGSCMDMSYLTVLGSATRGVVAAEREYNSLYEANLALEFDSFYRAAESDAERDERLNNLAERSIELDETRATVNSVRNQLYPIHMLAVERVSQNYRPQFASLPNR